MESVIGEDGPSSSNLDRTTVERNRRIEMSQLCSSLASLVPPHHFKSSKVKLSHVDKLEQATSYIRELTERVEGLKKRKEQLEKMMIEDLPINNMEDIILDDDYKTTGTRLPIIQLCDLGSSLEVLLVTGLEMGFSMLCEVIRVLEEEGGQVINVSFSTFEDKVCHTFHTQARSSRVGIETSRVHQRLQELIS